MLTRTDRRRFPILLAVLAAMALAMAMPFSMVHAESVSEGDTDLPANVTTNGVVEVGRSGAARGEIAEPKDHVFDTDWFRVELKADRTYRVDMKGAILISPSEYLDSELTLRLPQINAIYDEDGDFLFNTFSRDESSSHYLFRVTFHVHDDGTYYIAASGESFETGGYELRVIDITRDDGATPVAVTVQFGAASYTATEGGTAATVTVNLSADPERSVTIPITATGADGAGSGDYTLSETSVTIDSGETSATFIVTATDDSVDEDGESVSLAFGTNLPDGVSRGAQATSTVSLVDDDGATDTTAPAVESATVSTDGTAIDIVFDEDLDRSGTEPTTTAFDVTVDGGTPVNPASVAFHATDADTVVLTMSPAIAAGGTVTVAYDQPTSNALADAASNEVADFTGQAAPNRPAAPVVTLTAGNGQLTATWAAPANGGSAITGYDVEWKTAAQTWAEAATAGQSATPAADATDHEITGLTNDTEYTVRVRAGNDAGNGPWSTEASETPIAGDTTAPAADSATVSTDGAAIDIVFDEDLDTSGSAPAADAFEVTVDGGTAVNPDSVDFHATDADTVVLTMSPAIAAGGTVTVAYDEPTSNALADAASNEVADFTGQAAPNRPAAPVVTLTAGDEKLTATWSAPANGGSAITGYDMEWKSASQTWAEAATAGQSATPAADATDHEITGLTNDTEYTVRVRAGNDAGNGPWSTEASETPIAGDTTAPAVDSATVSTDGAAIDIVFDEDLDRTGTAPAADAFEVTVDGGTAVNPASVAFHATDADTVVLTMSPAIAAGGTVTVAYDEPTSNALADAASNEVADFTGQAAPNRPAAPVVTLTAGDEKLTATWSAPANGGREVTGYDVEWKTASQTWAEAATAGQSATPAADATDHEISGLTNNTAYTVRVRAGNDAGNGPWSTEASETPIAGDTTAPTVDSATVFPPGVIIDIVFDEDLDTSGSAPAADAFEVTVDGGTAVNPASVDFDEDSPDFDTIRLTMATADTIAAGATVTVAYDQPTSNALADAASNEVADFTQTVLNRPAAPVVTLTAGDEKLTATWSAPANGGSAITGYDVEWKTAAQTWAQAATAGQSATPAADATDHEISGLTNNTAYTVRVRAANDTWDGPWSEEASETPIAGDTTAPEVSSATVSTDGATIDIVFDEDLDTSGTAPAADAFEVTVDGGTAVNPDSVAFHATDADTVVLTMSPAIAAGGTVTVAYDEPTSNALADAASNEVADFTQTAPNRPAAPVVTLTAGDGQLTATWAAPANGGSEVTGYDVEWKTAAQTWAEAATAGQSATPAADATDHEITGLTNDTEYTVRVRAGNDAGDGPWSTEASETPFSPPGAPGGLNAQATYRQVELSWTDPNNSDIEGYQYRVSDDGGNTWDPDWTEIDGSGASTTSLTLSGLDHRTEYTFGVRAVDARASGEAASVTATPAATGVAHDWALRPPGIATGETFRLLIVTSDRRNGESEDVDDYNDHVQDAVDGGHSAIRAYSSDFRALVGTRDGASPRDNTHSNPGSDGDGEQIWWLNGPRAANDYDDLYDGDGWDHTNPVRTESGGSLTYYHDDDESQNSWERFVWTGARRDGSRAGRRHLGNNEGVGAFVGVPYLMNDPLRHDSYARTLNATLRLYGLSPVFRVEAPDAPYATTAAITTDPANGTDYRAGEVVKATVIFSEDVTVTGTPQLPLRIGDEERDADYVAGDSSSTVLSFSYLVTDDDTDRDGISIDAFALKLNGGSIKRQDTNVDAALTHTRVLAHDDQRVNLRPLITDIEVTSRPKADPSNDTYGLGEDIEITVTFSEAVNVTGDVEFGLNAGEAKRARLKSGNGTTDLVFAYTVQADDTDTNGIWIGNPDHDTIPTFDLQMGQSVVGAVSGLRADLDHDEEGRQDDHKVDGSLTAADATLSALSLSGITLVPAFAPGTTAYAATTSLSSTTVNIAISQGQNGANGRITAPTDADLNASGHQVTLAEDADTVITVMVTSSNSDSMRTYTVTVTRQAATDSTAPTVDSAAVSTDGATIDIVFDEDLDATGSAPAADAFEVTVDGGTAVDPASVDFHATDANTVVLTMSPAIAAGGTVTVAYDQPTSNALADAASNEVADFTGQAAPNRPAAPVVTLTPASGQITAAWTAPANGGSEVTGYDVEWKTAAQTWAEAATAGQSDTAAAAATGHEITGLTNGIEHTVRVRAGNDAGDGPWAEASANAGGADADLSALTVDGTGVTDFAADTTSYTVTVDHATTQVTVAATASDSNATVAYDPTDQVNLAGGKTAVTVTVTAEDGTTTKDYTVNFHRPVVPHDWSLRPEGVATGETFRVLIVTSTTRDAMSGDIAVYDAHVRSALASRGHADIRDYGPLFKALVATKGGAHPRSHTDTDPDDDGDGVEIWWLNGPKAADDYGDFYDGSWDHSNPTRTETGASKTFKPPEKANPDEMVWTGTEDDGTRDSRRHLGTDDLLQGTRASAVGSPYTGEVWRLGNSSAPINQDLGLYGLSGVFYIEPPDAPYATVAAITSTPANSGVYRAGETITATVAFSEAVTVSTVNGTPRLPLRIGSNTRYAGYESLSSDGMVLTFSYEVVDGDQDLDGVTVDKFALDLNGATITGIVGGASEGETAVLTHTGVVADEGHRVNLPPLITGVEVTSSPKADPSNDTYGLGEDIEITVTFSEAVTVTGDEVEGDVEFGLSVGGAVRARLKSGNGTTELVFAYTVQAGDTDTNGIWIGHPDHDDNPTLALQGDQSVVGVDSGLDALLEHEIPGTQGDHKVDGSLTVADATLSALSLSGITLDQTFTAGAAGTAITSFTATTSASATTVTATATQSGGSSGVVIDPADADTNTTGHQVTLAEDADTVITVTVTSSNGNSMRAYTVTVTHEAATDTTAPAADSVTVSTTGVIIDIVFDEDLDTSGSAPAADAFEVTVDGGTAVNPASVAFHATDADTVVLTMSPAIAAGGTVTVAYDEPTSNALADAASNEVADFTGQAAPNRPAAPVVTLTAGDGQLTATWAAPANGGSAITGYDVEWKTAAQTWAQAATAGQSDTAAADATDHEITGLTNDTAYTVRVRAGNDAGDGPWSADASETPVAASSDAELSDLTVDDGTGAASVDGFDPADTGYTVTVDHATAQVTVAATASDSNADVEIAPADADTGTEGHQVDLAGGKTEVTVTVTAEDGTTTKAYTVNFHRPVVPHDWSLRPEGVATGETFRVLIVTSTRRTGTTNDIDNYDRHVRSAVSNRGHADIRDYGPLFKALAATSSAAPRSHTGTDPDDDGPGEEIWWLNGPKAADDYADFYDGGWDHSNPARTEAGGEKRFVEFSNFDNAHRSLVWTGTDSTGSRHSSRQMSSDRPASGYPFVRTAVWSQGDWNVSENRSLSLYGLSVVFRVEAPDSPYATVAAVTSAPADGSNYLVGETITATVTFSEAVTVSGTPRLPLRIGSNTRDADYQSISADGMVLTFSYMVQDAANDQDLDGVSIDISSLKLNAGTITGAVGGASEGEAAALTHAGVVADADQSVNAHLPVAVPHDWSLRPEGVATGESFRLLIVTSTTRDAESDDIADYDAHVRSAVATGHDEIRDYAGHFQALAATEGGAEPRSHTGTDPDDDTSVEIWWLNGPRAADDYADFYDGDWDHSNPARTEAGDRKTFYDPTTSGTAHERGVWTGTGSSGTPSSITLGDSGGSSAIGSPYTGRVWRSGGGVDRAMQDLSLGLYGLSGVFYIEEPDAPYATVAVVTSSPSDTVSYQTGETITVTVTFSEAVEVDSTSGTPSLPLRIGDDERDAGYESISADGMVLTFSYEIVGDDVDLDGFTVEKFSLELNGGSITGTTGGHHGVAAALTHTGVAAHDDHRVNLPPLITGVEVTSTPQADPDNDTYGLGEDIEITVTFSEAVNVTGDVDFGLSVGGAVRARLKSGSGTAELVFAYTVQAGDTDTNGIWIGHPDHDDNPTLALQGDQSVVGVDSGLDALLEHEQEGTQGDHKVDGSLTAADATLSALSLSGITLDQTFTPGAAGTAITGFTATTSASTTTVTATATQSGGSSGVVIDPADADTNTTGHQVTLAEDADTVITVTVTSSNGNSMRAYTVTVTHEAATDSTAPTVDSAAVSTDGAAIDIVFDEDLDTSGAAPAADAFEVTVDAGTAVNPASVAFHATDSDTVVLTMSPAIAAGATVSVDYDEPTTNPLKDAADNAVESFTGQAAANRAAADIEVSWAAESYAALEGHPGTTVTVTLSAVPTGDVTVPISESLGGGASDDDYSGVPASVTFDSASVLDGDGLPTESFTVVATDDDFHDGDGNDETVTLSFGTLTGVTAGTQETATVGLIDNEVPATSDLIPDGTAIGEGFRLLFVTSNKRDATSTDIDDYNRHVQSRAKSHGHEDIRPYSSQFQALASTEAVNARDNTATDPDDDGPGEEIWWLDGPKAADDYRDFYDNTWDHQNPGREEDGDEVDFEDEDKVWTGTDKDGTTRFPLGQNPSGFAEPFETAGELFQGGSTTRPKYPLYGLSYALYAAAPADTPSVTRVETVDLPDGPYRSGDTINVRVIFSEAVTVNGAPTFPMKIGSDTLQAEFQDSESTSTELVFTHLVTDADYDNSSAGISNAELVLELPSGTSITRAGGSTVDAYPGSIVWEPDRKVNPNPRLTDIEITSTPQVGSTYGLGENIEFTVTFDDPVTVTGDPTAGDVRFRFFLGGTQSTQDRRDAELESGNGTKQLVYAYTVQPGDRDDPDMNPIVGVWVGGSGKHADRQGLFTPFPLEGSQSIKGSTGRAARLDHRGLSRDRSDHDDHLVNGSLTGADARLESLALDGITLAPAFAAGTLSYTASVDTSVDSTTVTASAVQSSAAVAIAPADADTNTMGHQVTLAEDADTVITVTVTASNGDSMRAYTVTVTREAATDSTAPTVDSAAVSTDGTTIDIVFDEDLDASGSAPAADAFEVTVDGGTAVNPASVAFHATDADTVVLTMSPAIAAGGTVTVAYDQPTSNALADAASNEVADFTGQAAPNRPAAPVVTLTAGDEKLTATWAAPANGGSAITGYDVEWKTAAQTWAEAATAGQSATPAADATDREITGLTNGIEHTVRVRAGNDAGDGPWSAEASETPNSSVTQVTVEFGAASYTATEGGAAATVTVNLSADPERSVTIPITAAGAGGATAGDYTLSANSVTIAGGSTSATFTVTATDDSVDDDGESVNLSFGTLPDEVSEGTQRTATEPDGQ